jgi:lipopolysaccharide/colanic/teichoic acid biosynthesis glycosyltransferase
LGLTLPLLLVIALVVKASSRGPVLFRHRRLGRNSIPFDLLKFRTMHDRPSAPGLALTFAGDPRVTAVGRFLRRMKLDELPQFLNVLRGEMALVGPRPDSPEYLAQLAPELKAVLALLPGITGTASLAFRHEEELLATVPPEQLERFYLEALLPQKIRLELGYARSASFSKDLAVLCRTAAAVFL